MRRTYSAGMHTILRMAIIWSAVVSITSSPPAEQAPGESCGAQGTAIPIATFAHSSNEDFISKVTSGQVSRANPFRPRVDLPVFADADGGLFQVDTHHVFLTYVSTNGWNNQLLNVSPLAACRLPLATRLRLPLLWPRSDLTPLSCAQLLCAIDMARLTNRTLVVPPFSWPARRGPAQVSVARLIDVRTVAALGVRALFEDEQGSVAAALRDAGVSFSIMPGEGQPHRKRRMPRWPRERWAAEHEAARAPPASGLSISCCLFWTWALPHSAALEIYGYVRYQPALVAAATAAAASLGPSFGAMHVRRGDKAQVDKAYTSVFGERMSAEYFTRLANREGIPRGSTVFVATDELDRRWFAPLAVAYDLRFVEDLDQSPLTSALSSFPQPLWADILAILEQIICIQADLGFVGSLPSTLSGHVVNSRRASTPADERELFTKLHESCCDKRTAADLMHLPGVRTLADVPCETHEGNPWC